MYTPSHYHYIEAFTVCVRCTRSTCSTYTPRSYYCTQLLNINTQGVHGGLHGLCVTLTVRNLNSVLYTVHTLSISIHRNVHICLHVHTHTIKLFFLFTFIFSLTSFLKHWNWMLESFCHMLSPLINFFVSFFPLFCLKYFIYCHYSIFLDDLD